MKKIILITTFLVIVTNITAQRIVINKDSLLNHFKKEAPYKVLKYYLNTYHYDFNYEELYYDTEIKNYLLKWLDKNEIENYEVEEIKDNFNQGIINNKEKREAFVDSYITSLHIDLDSIKAIDTLYAKYTNEAINDFVIRNKKNLLQNENPLLPPYEAMEFLSRIAYPEVYKQIKDWWYQSNQPAFYKNQISGLFSCMLIMQDPEAKWLFDGILGKVLQVNGSVIDLNFLDNLKRIDNSYAIKKIVEILPIQKETEYMADEKFPFDYATYDLLRDFMFRHKLESNPFDNEITRGKPYHPINEQLEYMRQHKNEIIEAANKLCKKLDIGEQYWIKNLSYNYVPKVQLQNIKSGN